MCILANSAWKKRLLSGNDLSDQEIEDLLDTKLRIKKHYKKVRPVILRPFPDTRDLKERFEGDGLDLRLGQTLWEPDQNTIELMQDYRISPQRPEDLAAIPRIPRTFGSDMPVYILKPGHSVLAESSEYIGIPRDLSGCVQTKSRLARCFTPAILAPIVHTWWHGHLAFELTNISQWFHIELREGDRLATLQLHRLHGKPSRQACHNNKLSLGQHTALP